MDDKEYDTKEAAEYLKISFWTLQTWRSRGIGPAYIRLGRKILYKQSALDKFVERVTIEPKYYSNLDKLNKLIAKKKEQNNEM